MVNPNQNDAKSRRWYEPRSWLEPSTFDVQCASNEIRCQVSTAPNAAKHVFSIVKSIIIKLENNNIRKKRYFSRSRCSRAANLETLNVRDRDRGHKNVTVLGLETYNTVKHTSLFANDSVLQLQASDWSLKTKNKANTNPKVPKSIKYIYCKTFLLN